MRHWLIALILLTGCLPSFADQTATKLTPDDDRYLALAKSLEKRGSNFDQVFAELCRTALADVDQNPKHRLDDQVRAMFGGMWLWIRQGGKPSLQGMNDKAFHFIGGGMFQGYFELGREAAVTKEERDSQSRDNFFDCDDLAATVMGARWLDVALENDGAHTRQWVELWATGKLSLSKSLPKLRWGHLQHGKVAPREQIAPIGKDVDAAIKFPEPTR
jgi:hypothetical protein